MSGHPARIIDFDIVKQRRDRHRLLRSHEAPKSALNLCVKSTDLNMFWADYFIGDDDG